MNILFVKNDFVEKSTEEGWMERIEKNGDEF
jgi:hypothetical protein